MKNREMDMFNAGIDFAARIVKEGGPEALEKEVAFRNVTGINSRLTAKQIDTGIDAIKEYTLKTVLTMTEATLYVNNGFGKKRLLRFREDFKEGTTQIQQGIVTWHDVCKNMERLTGVPMDLKDYIDQLTGMLR